MLLDEDPLDQDPLDQDPLDQDPLDVEPADGSGVTDNGATDDAVATASADDGFDGGRISEMITTGGMTVAGATAILGEGTFCDCACGCRRRAADHVCDACRTGDHSGGRDPFDWSDGWPRPHARHRGHPRAPGAA